MLASLIIKLRIEYKYRRISVSGCNKSNIREVWKIMIIIKTKMYKIKYVFSTIKMMEDKYMISLKKVNEYLKLNGS